MTTFYMLVGLPGTGKTTWAKKQNGVIISTDDIIETLGQLYGLTYNDMFDNNTYALAETVAHKVARTSFERNVDRVIWDQTNLTTKSRAKKLALVPSHYKKICVYFQEPSDLKERLQSRVGKHIPENVLHNMMKSFQYPKMDEGFDDIQSSS